MANKTSIYNEAQWRWLHDRHMEGYSTRDLAKFAICHRSTIKYHWRRLGLSIRQDFKPALSREEFLALEEASDFGK